MPAKDRNISNNCEKCGKSFLKANIARHRKTCMMGTLYCKKRNCSFATKMLQNCHTILRRLTEQKFVIHWTSALSVRNRSRVSTHFNVITKKYIKLAQKLGPQVQTVFEIMEKVDNNSESLKEELAACHYLLDDIHAVHGRQEVFNFSLSDLNTTEIKNSMNFSQTSTVLQKLT